MNTQPIPANPVRSGSFRVSAGKAVSWFLVLLFGHAMLLANNGTDHIPIGQWRHHLPGNQLLHLVETPASIIGATSHGMVMYNKDDNSVQRINKVDGLNDMGITALGYIGQKNALVVGYRNGNLDIGINGHYANISDIMQASILGSKRINKVVPYGNQALIACGFGIIHLDIANRLILDTWYIGPHGSMVEVNDIEVTDTMLYAATNAGLLAASTDAPNFADFTHWNRIEVAPDSNGEFNHIASHNGRLFVNRTDADADKVYYHDGEDWNPFSPPGGFDGDNTRMLRASGGKLLVGSGQRLDIFDGDMQLVRQVPHYYYRSATPNDALFDGGNTLWIADDRLGLIKEQNPQSYEEIILPGPDYPDAFAMAHSGEMFWVAHGGMTYTGSNQWNARGYSFLKDGRWTRHRRSDHPELSDMADFVDVTIDPANPHKAYLSAWYGGLVVASPDGVISRYDETNSTLQLRADLDDWLRVGGAAVDHQGNLWVTNSEVSRPLSVRKTNGEWMSFTSGGVIDGRTRLREILIDNHGQKWINLPGNGILVFKEHTLEHTGNFDARRLTTQTGGGGLPSNRVHSVAMDQTGYIWVGTDQGVGVFYSPLRAFDGSPFDAHRIIVEQEDGFAGYLFETETVTSITVDGSNKKWFGTERSGAFLLSADGRETILHFNKDNSPLPSNTINDIAINGRTGEVFFATDLGVASYRAFATEATRRQGDDVYAYPNPVRSGYDGYIAVQGLVRNASVKITDISGNLVWETIAEGGQAVWNGQDLWGRRPATGVYLVFSTNDDGEETMVTKIMFFN